MASSSDKPLIERLKERKIVQWALGYLAGGFVVLQLMDALEGPLGLSQLVQQGVLMLLLVGFPVTLVLAWYHGEQGRQRVSGPELLIIAGLLVVSGFGIRFFTTQDSGANGEVQAVDANVAVQPSVAVLPFVNMSGNPDNEYFSDGITEELLNALAQLPGLRVPGRTSSFAFKGQNITIRQIADTLNVAHVLEGSVRRDADRVLITAQLVDAQTDTHLWSDTYERQLEDIFAIQREIATAIADQLQLALTGGQEAALVARGTDNPEAHDAYLRGRFFWNQRTGQSLQSAIAEFERATDLDPEYAEAHSGLADSYLLVNQYPLAAGALDTRTNLERGLAAAQRAVLLSPDLGMAHTSLAWGFVNTGEWDAAEREFELAIELSPNYATAHQWYSFLLSFTGRTAEGVASATRAFELDPVSLIVSDDVGNALDAAGRFQEAADQYRKTIELDPNWPTPRWDLAFSLLQLGQYDEALEAYLVGARLEGLEVATERTAFEAIIRYHRSGEPQPLAFRDGYLWAGEFYSLTGQRERALQAAESRLREGYLWSVLYLDFFFNRDLLGDDPRYQALLEEAGITW